MTFTASYAYSLELLGVPNSTFFLVSKIIGGAIAPPLPLDLLLSILILRKGLLPPKNILISVAVSYLELTVSTIFQFYDEDV